MLCSVNNCMHNTHDVSYSVGQICRGSRRTHTATHTSRHLQPATMYGKSSERGDVNKMGLGVRRRFRGRTRAPLAHHSRSSLRPSSARPYRMRPWNNILLACYTLTVRCRDASIAPLALATVPRERRKLKKVPASHRVVPRKVWQNAPIVLVHK